jgi:hypothetical protein
LALQEISGRDGLADHYDARARMDQSSPPSDMQPCRGFLRLPLYARVLIGVARGKLERVVRVLMSFFGRYT